MEQVRHLSFIGLRVYVYMLRYLVWREEQIEKLLKQAHYLGRSGASYIYPEKKRYRINILWYSIYLWLSIDNKRDHSPT